MTTDQERVADAISHKHGGWCSIHKGEDHITVRTAGDQPSYIVLPNGRWARYDWQQVGYFKPVKVIFHDPEEMLL